MSLSFITSCERMQMIMMQYCCICATWGSVDLLLLNHMNDYFLVFFLLQAELRLKLL